MEKTTAVALSNSKGVVATWSGPVAVDYCKCCKTDKKKRRPLWLISCLGAQSREGARRRGNSREMFGVGRHQQTSLDRANDTVRTRTEDKGADK